MCHLQNIALEKVTEKCDRRTDRRTDIRRTKWSLCVAMLRRRHKNEILHSIYVYVWSTCTRIKSLGLVNNKIVEGLLIYTQVLASSTISLWVNTCTCTHIFFFTKKIYLQMTVSYLHQNRLLFLLLPARLGLPGPHGPVGRHPWIHRSPGIGRFLPAPLPASLSGILQPCLHRHSRWKQICQ